MFAKIITLDGDENKQVLFYTEYDNEADETKLHQIADVDGCRMDLALSFVGEKQVEAAEKALKAVTEETAKIIFEKAETIIGKLVISTENGK